MSLIRRMLLSESELNTMGLKYTTGECIGRGEVNVSIEHGLGETPFLFAFIGESGEETSGTLAGVFMNTGITTNYTTALTKEWIDIGCRSNGIDTAYMLMPNSISYGVFSIDENKIVINQYSSRQLFISGKTYKWIAIADWRA